MNSDIVASACGLILGYVGWPSVLLLTGPWAAYLTRAWKGQASIQSALTHLLAFLILCALMGAALVRTPNLLGAESNVRLRGVTFVSSLAGLILFLSLGRIETAIRKRTSRGRD